MDERLIAGKTTGPLHRDKQTVPPGKRKETLAASPSPPPRDLSGFALFALFALWPFLSSGLEKTCVTTQNCWPARRLRTAPRRLRTALRRLESWLFCAPHEQVSHPLGDDSYDEFLESSSCARTCCGASRGDEPAPLADGSAIRYQEVSGVAVSQTLFAVSLGSHEYAVPAEPGGIPRTALRTCL